MYIREVNGQRKWLCEQALVLSCTADLLVGVTEECLGEMLHKRMVLYSESSVN